MPDSTLTADAFGTEVSRGGQISTRIVFIADTENPRAPSSSHTLDEIDEVRFQRGDQRRVERKRRLLTLSFPDPRMSSTHGSLQVQGGHWIFDDPASKNGSIVDGAIAERAVLVDGSVLELGRSVFVFRRSTIERELPRHLGSDLTAQELPRWPSGMETFCPALACEYADLIQLASSPVSILLRGETGTGKEVVARAIHALSKRSGTFVAVNCGAIPPTLIDDELFGHRRGTFTGALTDRRGLVRAADQGTLFLDEIGDLPLTLQATLLRVLQEREVKPIGEDRPVAVDLRVVAATLRDLDQAIAAGAFRRDLHARLAGHVVSLPPLRERREDFGLLLAALLPRTGEIRLSPPALRELLRYDWPDNIRELEQALTTASVLARDGVIERVHLPAAIGQRRAAEPPPKLDDDDDRDLRDRLVALFAAHEGNVAAVAEILGKHRQQVYKWVKRLGIDLSVFRR